MQVIQIKHSETSVIKRVASLFLAMLMLISFVSVPGLTIFAEDTDNTGGFVLSLEWNSNDSNNETENPSTVYKYDSDLAEKRIITLKVRYNNKQISTNGYDKSKIIITIPGLKNAFRSGADESMYKPVGVAADEISNPNKTHDWSYSYTQATDTFTFTNNNRIDSKSTFEGSFEIMWIVPSRDTINNYSVDLVGKLNAVTSNEGDIENYVAVSNSVKYCQIRERDQYKLSESAHFLYDDEIWAGNEPPVSDYKSYTWVNYTVTGSDDTYARGVQNIERFECYFLEGAIVQGEGLVKTGKTRNDFGDEKTYECWAVEKKIDSSMIQYLNKVNVAYPPEYSTDEVTNYVMLYGTYFDEEEESLLAQTLCTVDLSTYWFRDIPGFIYDVVKHSYGVSDSSYIRNHDNNLDINLCKKYGAVNAAHLSNGRHEYCSTFDLDLNFKDKEEGIRNEETGEITETIYDLKYYDLEFVDDMIDVSMKESEDGSNLRQLTDEEYHFTAIRIPANSEILNANDLPIKADTYKVEIYLRHAGGEFSYRFLTDKNIPEPDIETTIQSTPQFIELEDENVVGIKIVIRGLKESFKTTTLKDNKDVIQCYYKFHISDDDLSKIITDGGQMINNMYFNLYKMGLTDNYEWFNGNFTRAEYSSDREYDRDMQLYKHEVDRESAVLHILEIPSEFRLSNVSIKHTNNTKYRFEFDGSITSEFTFGEGADLSKFSMYTIIPKGLQLSDIYNTEDSLKEVLTFSGDNLTSAYISEHTSIEIIDDYRNSGRQYLAFHYDFSDNPITSKNINVSNIPMYADKDNIDGQSESFTMHAGMMIDQIGNWYSTSSDNYGIDDNIWSDMNNNGDISEKASFNSGVESIYNPIDTHMELVKFVKTEKTDGFVNPSADEYVPMTYADGNYTYRLRANVGESISVDNFIFFDAIETYDKNGDQYEWQGEFVDVDYSYAKSIFGDEPTIYYSPDVEKFPEKNGVYDITPDALKGSGWTTEKPETVRSIAVYFDGSYAPKKSVIYIDINMRAPSPAESYEHDYYDKITINECAIGYNKKFNDEDKQIYEHQNLPSNAVRVKFMPPMGKITLVKKDASDLQTITSEAEFELYHKTNSGDKQIGTYVTNNGKIVVKDLVYGDYYFKEKNAPKGYKVSNNSLNVKLFDEEPDESITEPFYNERKEGQVTIKKVSDRIQTLGLEGAEFDVYSSDGELVKSGLKTGKDGQLTITGLEWGDYILKEIKPPDGYNISDEETYFTINADNDAGRELSLTIENEQQPACATLVKYEAKENGENTKNVLSGAVYELYPDGAEEGTDPLGIYITDDNGKIYAENLTFGKYYFIETVAPKGYELNESKIEFEVDHRHTSESLIVEAYDKRKLGRVTLKKVDDDGKAVKGAVYGLFDAETNEQISESRIASSATFLTSEEGNIEFNGLYWGDYYLKEITAPTGYELSNEKIEFSISRDTVSKRILLDAIDERMKGTVNLIKYNEEETKTLKGAEYTLYKNDGSIYLDDLTTDDSGMIVVEGIQWGSYYFLEKTAPEGYGLSSEKIRFSVNYLTAGKTQEVIATDPKISCKLTVAKKIKISDIVFAHGNPTFTFKVTGDDGRKYYQAVTFSEKYLDDYLLANPTATEIEASVTFTDLAVGHYTVSEVETNRYTTDKIEAENGDVNDKVSAKFDIKDANTEYKATFINQKNSNSGTSHSSQISNILNCERKLTGIVATWNGPKTITSNTLDRDLLEVWAIYDDGTQVKIEDTTAYTLDPASFDTSMNGDFSVKVSYSEGGRTRKDSFDVNIDVSDPFTWEISEVPFTDTNGKKYDGTATINGYLGNSSFLNIPEVVTGWVELTNSNTGAHKEHTEDAGKKYKVVGVEGRNSSNAMYGINNCDTLKLPKGLETIGDSTFKNCATLIGELEIPDSVTSIGNNAFYQCNNLTGNLTIPNRVTTIGDDAFRYCGFNGELKLGNNVTSIGNNAFQGVKFIEGLEIPDSVTSIGNAAFNLGGFTGNLTFGQNSKLKNIGNFAFYSCGFTGSLAIPSAVETIGNKAFGGCSGFNGTLTFGENSNLKTIGEYAFTGRGSITDGNSRNDMHFTGLLKIPGSVESIGVCAFRCDTGFTGLELQEGIKEIGDNAFDGCTGFTGSLTIPDSVTSIGNNAFDGCTGFTGSLMIGNQVNTIGDYAFRNCKFTGNLVIPDGVTKIGTRAFNSCSGFTGGLIIPSSVTEIGEAAFIVCNLGKLTLKEGLEKIGAEAFSQCSLSGEIYVPKTVKEIGKQAFAFNYSISKIQAPKSIQESVDKQTGSNNAFYRGQSECHTVYYYD